LPIIVETVVIAIRRKGYEYPWLVIFYVYLKILYFDDYKNNLRFSVSLFSYSCIMLVLIWQIYMYKNALNDVKCERESLNITDTPTYWLYVKKIAKSNNLESDYFNCFIFPRRI